MMNVYGDSESDDDRRFESLIKNHRENQFGTIKLQLKTDKS